MSEDFALGILIIAFGAQLMRLFGFYVDSDNEKVWRKLWWSAVTFFFAYLVFLGVAQYIAWKESGPPLSYFVPPYASITYVIKYSFYHFAFSYVISFIIACGLMLFLRFINTRYNERFLWREEGFMVGIGLLVLGHPLWIVYLLSLSIIACIGGLIFFIKKEGRMSLYHFWIPLSLLTILISRWL